MGEKLSKKSELEIMIKEAMSECLHDIIDKKNKKAIKTTEGKNYFKETEKLLYAYPILKVQVQQIELDIEDLKKEEYTDHSKDIVKMKSGGGACLGEYELQDIRIKNRIRSLNRTNNEIKRIDRALEQVKNDEGYEIIKLKYFDNPSKTIEEMSELLHISESTVKRWKNRIINKLKIVLFGADAL